MQMTGYERLSSLVRVPVIFRCEDLVSGSRSTSGLLSERAAEIASRIIYLVCNMTYEELCGDNATERYVYIIPCVTFKSEGSAGFSDAFAQDLSRARCRRHYRYE